MTKVWTGKRVCDDTNWWCHCAVNHSLKKESLKITIPCHTLPPLYCATLCFLSYTSVCKLCRIRRVVRNSINTRKWDTFVFLFVWNSAFGDTSNRRKPQSHDDKVTAVLMGQWKPFYGFFKYTLFVFYMFFVFFQQLLQVGPFKSSHKCVDLACSISCCN